MSLRMRACSPGLAEPRAQCKWVHFVQSLDSSPKARSALYYCGVARAMAEAVGSVMTEDLGEASVRASLERRLPADDVLPFASDED